MERGVVVGGLLVSVSLVIAVLLNSNANRGSMAIGSVDAERAEDGASITRANSARGSCHIAFDPADQPADSAHPDRPSSTGAGGGTRCSCASGSVICVAD